LSRPVTAIAAIGKGISYERTKHPAGFKTLPDVVSGNKKGVAPGAVLITPLYLTEDSALNTALASRTCSAGS
jgi:hypothetical protein